MLIWTSRNIPNVGLFSAYAEVFPVYVRVPRPRSDFSLPTQRCFWGESRFYGVFRLFSAYAEVFPRFSKEDAEALAFLCLRRGVSKARIRWLRIHGFSLPTQRCFSLSLWKQPALLLFSAYAEVFPGLTTRSVLSAGLFSAYAEVFPATRSHRISWNPFLCLRRGVSECERQKFRLILFSLPTQRCFRKCFHVLNPPGLFSAYAEVFLGDAAITNAKIPFLCLRRGVSELIGVGVVSSPFSLPTQRCFWLLEQMKRRACLFSAYAEVFLLIDTRGLKRTLFSLPTQRCFQ